MPELAERVTITGLSGSLSGSNQREIEDFCANRKLTKIRIMQQRTPLYIQSLSNLPLWADWRGFGLMRNEKKPKNKTMDNKAASNGSIKNSPILAMGLMVESLKKGWRRGAAS